MISSRLVRLIRTDSSALLFITEYDTVVMVYTVEYYSAVKRNTFESVALILDTESHNTKKECCFPAM